MARWTQTNTKLRSKTKVIGGSIEKVGDLPSGALMAQVQIRLRGK